MSLQFTGVLLGGSLPIAAVDIYDASFALNFTSGPAVLRLAGWGPPRAAARSTRRQLGFLRLGEDPALRRLGRSRLSPAA